MHQLKYLSLNLVTKSPVTLNCTLVLSKWIMSFGCHWLSFIPNIRYCQNINRWGRTKSIFLSFHFLFKLVYRITEVKVICWLTYNFAYIVKFCHGNTYTNWNRRFNLYLRKDLAYVCADYAFFISSYAFNCIFCLFFYAWQLATLSKQSQLSISGLWIWLLLLTIDEAFYLSN